MVAFTYDWFVNFNSFKDSMLTNVYTSHKLLQSRLEDTYHRCWSKAGCGWEHNINTTTLKHVLYYASSQFTFSILLDAGKRLRNQIIVEPNAKMLFYFSPYLRTKQVSMPSVPVIANSLCTLIIMHKTLDEILPFFEEEDILGILEEPRIR